jgi:hypothetical protein
MEAYSEPNRMKQARIRWRQAPRVNIEVARSSRRMERKVGYRINLRNDLAKLSDSALAAEFDRMCEYRLARFGSAPAVGSLRGFCRYGFAWLWPRGRGLIRARWAYRLRIGYYWTFRGPMGTQYLVECEIKDLRDEMQRRVKTRRRHSNASF